KGLPAWLLWLGVHVVKLVGFRNRVLVLVNWAWNYLSFRRAVRLILPSAGEAEELDLERPEQPELERALREPGEVRPPRPRRAGGDGGPARIRRGRTPGGEGSR